MPLKLACKTMLTLEMAWYRASLFSVQFSRDGTILKAKHMPKQLKTLKCILLDASSDKWMTHTCGNEHIIFHGKNDVYCANIMWVIKFKFNFVFDVLGMFGSAGIYNWICYTCIIHPWLNCSFARWLGHGYFRNGLARNAARTLRLLRTGNFPGARESQYVSVDGETTLW